MCVQIIFYIKLQIKQIGVLLSRRNILVVVNVPFQAVLCF